tara:strand:- start:1115 stop:1411 length:297 start_codon:yes stop_codon:yes gene_type:complete
MGYHAIQSGFNKARAAEARKAGRSGVEGLKEIIYPVKGTLRELSATIVREREAFAERRKAVGDVFKYDSFIVFKGSKMHGRYTLVEGQLKKTEALMPF